jgi:two-component system, chemotaxis family, chemotaxis protein CheY
MAKVMIVDDSLFMRNHLVKLLTNNGYETVAAENGDRAMSDYQQEQPDVVVMDITMPGTDGWAALTRIRQFDPQARVIMLTSLDHEQATARAIRLGAKDCLTKPVTPDHLLGALSRILR